MELIGCENLICPEIWKQVEKMKHFSKYCIPHAACDVLFEVENFGGRFIVDVKARTCTRRSWDITGIPCIHASFAIHLLCEEAIDYCHEAYFVAKYHETYQYGLPPLNGEMMWPRAEVYRVVPPSVKKMPGMPKKKRKRNPCEENPRNPTKLRRTGVRMTCRDCKHVGHNQKSCKNAAVPKAPSNQGKAGRPRKNEAISTMSSTSATRVSSTRTMPSNSAARASASASRHYGTRPSTPAAHAATRRGITNSSSVSMGSAGHVTGVMPTQKKQIFIPPRSFTKKGKEKATLTQESCS